MQTKSSEAETHVTKLSKPSFSNMKCIWLGLQQCLPNFSSNLPTGPSFGIGYGTGTIPLNQNTPSLSLLITARPSALSPLFSYCTSYLPLESVSHTSILTSDTGSPFVVLTVQRTSRDSPSGSAEMEVPLESEGASCVWNGPRTVPSVEEAGLGWSIESTRRERPTMSERRMNSYNVLVQIGCLGLVPRGSDGNLPVARLCIFVLPG